MFSQKLLLFLNDKLISNSLMLLLRTSQRSRQRILLYLNSKIERAHLSLKKSRKRLRKRKCQLNHQPRLKSNLSRYLSLPRKSTRESSISRKLITLKRTSMPRTSSTSSIWGTQTLSLISASSRETTMTSSLLLTTFATAMSLIACLSDFKHFI